MKDVIDRIEERTGADSWDVAISLHRALCSGELSAESAHEEVIPRGLWRSVAPCNLDDRTRYWEFAGLRYSNPTLTTEAVDRWLADAAPSVAQPQVHRPAAEKSALAGFGFHESGDPRRNADPLPSSLPPYVQFQLDMVALLGGTQAIAGLKKREVAEAIMKAWPVESLGPLKGRGTEDRAPVAVEYMAMFLRPVEAQFGGAKPRRAAENGNVAAEGSNGSNLTEADDFATEPVEDQTV